VLFPHTLDRPIRADVITRSGKRKDSRGDVCYSDQQEGCRRQTINLCNESVRNGREIRGSRYVVHAKLCGSQLSNLLNGLFLHIARTHCLSPLMLEPRKLITIYYQK